MNSFNKSCVLFAACAVLLVCSVSGQEGEQTPAAPVELDQPAATVEQSAAPVAAKKAHTKSKRYEGTVNYEGSDISVEFHYKEGKTTLSEQETVKVAEWIESVKMIFINFLDTVTKPEFNKDELDKEVASFSEGLKSGAASIVESDLYKSNKEVQQQVKTAFQLLNTNVANTRNEANWLAEEEFSVEMVKKSAFGIQEVYTKISQPNWIVDLKSLQLDGQYTTNLCHSVEVMLTNIGLGKAVDGVKKAAYSIMQTL